MKGIIIEALESGFEGSRPSRPTEVEVRVRSERVRGKKEMDLFFYITPDQAEKLRDQITESLANIEQMQAI